MQLDDKKLRLILTEGNYVTDEEIDKVQKEQTGESSLAHALIAGGLVTNDLLGQAVAEYYDIGYADLNSHPASPNLIRRIPEHIARQERLILREETDTNAIIATDEPDRPELKEMLEKKFEKTVEIQYALSTDIDATLQEYKRALDMRFSEIIEAGGEVAPALLQEIFSDALTHQASDIHFEPYTETVRVRFRVDGVLQEVGDIPKDYYENILNRIKVLSNLRIDEHFIAQDGSLQYESDEVTYDMRTSIVPTLEGEKIVLRILTSYIGSFSLDSLGLTKENQELLRKAAANPFGMILATGPTGSGKTTMLYALLKMLSKPEVNIMTIEEPVEYKLEGVNQIQVDRANELSFAKGLRSIVRQDPDIILVGEIRDEETTEIAVNAALTGHLMLSTFHANDAATAIPRLLDMNAEPFLLASTMELIVAQRLVRKICDNCRHSVTTSHTKLKKQHPAAASHLKGKKITLYKGKGCSVCNHTGYKGRTAIFELIQVTPKMEELILTNPSTQEVWKLAKKEGSVSMFEDGIVKVKAGVTTVEELARVAPSQYVKSSTKK